MEQNRAPGKRRRNPPIDPMVLVPTPTSPRPRQRLVNLIAVPHKLINDVLFRRHARNALARHLGQPFHHPVPGPGHALDQAPVANGGVRAGKDEVVGHVWACERDVGFRLFGPFLLQRDAVAADYGIGRFLADIEARGADNDIEIVVLAVFGVDAGFVDGHDGAICERDVGLGERFEVAVSGSYSPVILISKQSKEQRV